MPARVATKTVARRKSARMCTSLGNAGSGSILEQESSIESRADWFFLAKLPADRQKEGRPRAAFFDESAMLRLVRSPCRRGHDRRRLPAQVLSAVRRPSLPW